VTGAATRHHSSDNPTAADCHFRDRRCHHDHDSYSNNPTALADCHFHDQRRHHDSDNGWHCRRHTYAFATTLATAACTAAAAALGAA